MPAYPILFLSITLFEIVSIRVIGYPESSKPCFMFAPFLICKNKSPNLATISPPYFDFLEENIAPKSKAISDREEITVHNVFLCFAEKYIPQEDKAKRTNQNKSLLCIKSPTPIKSQKATMSCQKQERRKPKTSKSAVIRFIIRFFYTSPKLCQKTFRNKFRVKYRENGSKSRYLSVQFRLC